MPAILLLLLGADRRRVGLPAHAGAGVSPAADPYGASASRRTGSGRARAGPPSLRDRHRRSAADRFRPHGGRAGHPPARRSPASAATKSIGEQFHKWATAIVDAAKTKAASPTPTSPISARSPSATRRGFAAARRRTNVTKAFADLAARAQAERRGVRRCSSATAASTAGRRRSTCPGPDLDRATTTRKLLAKLRRSAIVVREHRELERRVPAGAGRPGPDDRHRHQDRRRAQRNAVPRLLRRGARRRRRRSRPQRPRLGARGVRLRARPRSQQAYEQDGQHPDRARDARRRRRGEAGGDAVPGAATRRGRPRSASADPALRALVEAARRARAQIAELRLRKDEHRPRLATSRSSRSC